MRTSGKGIIRVTVPGIQQGCGNSGLQRWRNDLLKTFLNPANPGVHDIQFKAAVHLNTIEPAAIQRTNKINPEGVLLPTKEVRTHEQNNPF